MAGQAGDVNLKKLRDLVYESRQYLFEQAGFTLDIFAESTVNCEGETENARYANREPPP